MLKVLVKITEFTVTAGGFFGVIAFAVSLYLWIFDDSSAWVSVIGSVVFLIFLGGVAVLFRISEQLEEASKVDTKMFRAITFLGSSYMGKERVKPFLHFVETGA